MKTQISKLLYRHYGLQTNRVKRLKGYSNENYWVSTNSGRYILKLYDPKPKLHQIIIAENQALEKLSADESDLFPKPQKNSDGKMLFYSEGCGKIARLLSFVEGKCLNEFKYTSKLLYLFGSTLALLDTRLLDFKNIAIELRKSGWDLRYYHLNKKSLPFIENFADRKLVEYFFMQTKKFAEPMFKQARKSTIQGDANERNVLVKEGKISGIIDFGDLSYTTLINELAIAVAYATLYVKNPIEDVLPLVEGYHNILPLQENEIKLLYYLIPLRLCISVCNSAKAAHDMPENEYAFINKKQAWNMLRKWIRLSPAYVENRFRAVTIEAASRKSMI